jgi:hypothetical protein
MCDRDRLARAIALSQRSRDEGTLRFAAIVAHAAGKVLTEAMNDSHADGTSRAGLEALRRVSAKISPA